MRGPEAAGDHVGQEPPGLADGIEVGVVNGDVDTGGPAGGDGGMEHCDRLVRSKPAAAMHGRVHRRHHLVGQHIGIEMDEEAVELGAPEPRQRAGNARLETDAAERRQVEIEDAGRQRRTVVLPLVVMVAEAEGNDILVADQRLKTLEAGEPVGPAAGGKRQLQRGALPVRIVESIKEIGMPVDEEKAVAAAPPQRQQQAEKDGAIAAEDDGELPGPQHVAHAIGELWRPLGDEVAVERLGFGIDAVFAARRNDAAHVRGAQAPGEIVVEQHLRQALNAVGVEAEAGRRLEDGKGRCCGHGKATERIGAGFLLIPPPAVPTFRTMANRSFTLLNRFLQFRNELGLLWRAFRSPATPMHLKALMLLVPLYLLSPIDLLPDFIPLVGWLDDIVVIPMLVSWIVSMLPREQPARARAGSKTIDGTYRRR